METKIVTLPAFHVAGYRIEATVEDTNLNVMILKSGMNVTSRIVSITRSMFM